MMDYRGSCLATINAHQSPHPLETVLRTPVREAHRLHSQQVER